MDPISVLTTVAKLASKVELEDKLSQIQKSISNTYLNLAASEIDSALQAAQAASRSSEPQIEFRDAISHLRSAHNNFVRNVTKTEEVSTWFGFSSSTREVFERHQKAEILLVQCQLANMIRALYAFLGDTETAKDWALKQDRAVDILMGMYKELKLKWRGRQHQYDRDEIIDPWLSSLRDLNPDFVITTYRYNSDPVVNTEDFSAELSDLGIQYLEAMKHRPV